MKFCDRPYRYIYTNGYGKPGDVLICQWMKNTPARVIGNVLENDLHTIWHGEKAELLRSSFSDQSFRYCEKTSCPYLENDSLPEMSAEDYAKKAVVKDYPDKINLAHDMICNHKCPSCRYEVFSGNNEYANNMINLNNRLLPYVNKANHINACGLGDAFSSPHMMDLLQRIQPENKGVSVSLETNGVLCDKNHWSKLRRLCETCKVSVHVTPNSYDRATYKYLSGGMDDLERVKQNLYLLRELRNKKIIDKFDITMVVQESNFRELPSFVEKSLNEFEADEVIIRTIYKWNKLTAEDYWFKDVMNPLHPYHKDMLEVMKSPILLDKRVYNWTNFNMHPLSLHPAYRYKEYLELIKKLFLSNHQYNHHFVEDDNGCKDISEMLGSRISMKMQETESKHFIIYGDNILTEILIILLQGTNSTFPSIKCCVARDTNRDNILGIPLVRMNSYDFNDEDLIMISNFMDKAYVERDLRALGYEGELISIDELLS